MKNICLYLFLFAVLISYQHGHAESSGILQDFKDRICHLKPSTCLKEHPDVYLTKYEANDPQVAIQIRNSKDGVNSIYLGNGKTPEHRYQYFSKQPNEEYLLEYVVKKGEENGADAAACFRLAKIQDGTCKLVDLSEKEKQILSPDVRCLNRVSAREKNRIKDCYNLSQALKYCLNSEQKCTGAFMKYRLALEEKNNPKVNANMKPAQATEDGLVPRDSVEKVLRKQDIPKTTK